MAFDATVGGASANSLVDVAYADDYFADRPSAAAWAALTNKESLLISATDYFSLFDYGGFPTTTEQALPHPRTQLANRSGTGFEGTNVIAEDIKKGVTELALYLNTNAASFVAEDNVTEVKVGPIGVKFDKKTFGEYSSLPLNIQRLVDPYLSKGGSAGITLVRS